jgi:hypothetical protein
MQIWWRSYAVERGKGKKNIRKEGEDRRGRVEDKEG